MIRSALIALQFLTRVPVGRRLHDRAPTPQQIGASLLFYPLVGLLLGALLVGVHGVLLQLTVPAPLCAALLLTVWVAVTGALHLDGLADSADAWIGGRGDRARTLAIMKDPCCGPLGVTALVLVLLLKFAALHAVCAGAPPWPLLLAPLLGRMALPLLFLSTPYVRPGGLGSALAAHLPRRATAALLAACGVGLLAVGTAGGVALVVALGVFLIVRAALLRRLGGTTGDTAGTLVELTEAAVLIGVVCVDALRSAAP